MRGDYEQDLKAIVLDRDKEVGRLKRELAAAEKILYRLARLARNTDGLFPTTKAKEVAHELLALRRLDCARYDREIIATKGEIDPAAAGRAMARREAELMEKCLIGPGGFGKERGQLTLPYAEYVKVVAREPSDSPWKWDYIAGEAE